MLYGVLEDVRSGTGRFRRRRLIEVGQGAPKILFCKRHVQCCCAGLFAEFVTPLVTHNGDVGIMGWFQA